MLMGILTLVGTALGFLPAILQFFTVKANNAQAIALRQMDIDAAAKGYSFQLALEDARADTAQQEHVYSFAAGASGVKWVDALAVFVRPYITLWLFHVYLGGIAFLALYAVANGVEFKEIVTNVFDDAFKGLVGSIVGFWFGDRGGKRMLASALATSQPPTNRLTPLAPRPLTPDVQAPGLGRIIPAPAGDRPGV